MLVDHMLGSNTSISKDPNDDYVSFDAEELKGIRVKTLPLFHGKPIHSRFQRSNQSKMGYR